jgi:glucosamine--fructose-6-phosphate aminotransferase (isomerizing)
MQTFAWLSETMSEDLSSTDRTGGSSLSLMAREALEAPQAVARFLTLNAHAIAQLGSRLSFNPPSVVLT